MSHHPGYGQKPRSRYAVISSEQPVIDQGDPQDSKWMQAGGDARDRGRMVELISKNLTGSERMMVGLAWFEPGDVHLLHHHPHADEWYYVVHRSALFTVGGDLIRGIAGTAMFIPAGVPHRIENDGPGTLHIAWGFDKPELIEVGIVWDELPMALHWCFAVGRGAGPWPRLRGGREDGLWSRQHRVAWPRASSCPSGAPATPSPPAPG